MCHRVQSQIVEISMRRGLKTVLFLVILTALTRRDAYSQCSSAADEVVRMRIEESVKGISSGFAAGHVRNLGDQVSVAILRVYGIDGVSSPKAIGEYLPIIREAFLDSDEISNESDRTPVVTLLLLQSVKQKIVDKNLLQDVESTLAFVKSKTAHKVKHT